MISFLRRYAVHIIWVIVISFVLTMFAGTMFFGGASAPASRQVTHVNQFAVIGDIPVSRRNFTLFYQDRLNQLVADRPFVQIPPEMGELLSLEAFNQAMQFAVLLDAADDANIRLTRAEEKDMMTRLLAQAGVETIDELKTLFNERNIPYDDVIDSQKDDARVQKFIEQLRQDVTVTDEDIDRLYTEVDVRHILIQRPEDGMIDAAVATANIIVESINSGSITFEEAAEKFSDDTATAANGGRLGWVSSGTLLPSFEAVMYTLDKGRISEPFETIYGAHIIRVDDKKDRLRPVDFSYASEKQSLLEKRQGDAVARFMEAVLRSDDLNINDEQLSAAKARYEGNADAAIGAYYSWSSRQPNSPIPHYLLARFLLQEEMPDRALEEVQRANVKAKLVDITFPYGQILLGDIYAAKNDRAAALTAYDRALSLAENDFMALNAIKQTFERIGNSSRVAKADAAIAELTARAEALNRELESPSSESQP